MWKYVILVATVLAQFGNAKMFNPKLRQPMEPNDNFNLPKTRHSSQQASNLFLNNDDYPASLIRLKRNTPEGSSSPIYVTDDGEHESNIPSSGLWEPWSNSSECSRSCGGGVAYQTRVCTEEDESLCQGPSTRHISCNTHVCVPVDFRTQQCSVYNHVRFEGRVYTWLPYTRAPNKCELNCWPHGERFYYRHKWKVIDGTSCGTDQICVTGNCIAVGCDGVLGSRKHHDKCRVCGGDGSSCTTFQDVFDSKDLQVGYHDVVLIPAGATSIQINETQATSNNYLAIRNTAGHYYLNGNWSIEFSREIPIASTIFYYDREPKQFEKIHAVGPTSEAIYIVLLYQESNPAVTFQYNLPVPVTYHSDRSIP